MITAQYPNPVSKYMTVLYTTLFTHWLYAMMLQYSLVPERGMRLDPQPPVCLCIKTELCQKETLKTWLNKNKDNRTRAEITNWFVEVSFHCFVSSRV